VIGRLGRWIMRGLGELTYAAGALFVGVREMRAMLAVLAVVLLQDAKGSGH
jgi:hypothetical protein